MITVLLTALASSVFGTIAHQTELSNLPVGLALSYASVAIGALEARQEKLGRLFFLFEFGLLIFLFAQNITRDTLIPANSLGIMWAFGSVALAALVSLWPRMRVHR